MKPSYILIGLAGLLVAMTVAVAVKEISSDEGGGYSRGGRTIPVQVAEVRLHKFADVVEAVGTVRAEESVAITASVADTVLSVDFASGDTVNAGQVLMTLADAEELAVVADAEAGLDEAQRDVGRLENLAASNSIARSELDQARSILKRAQAQLDISLARLDDHTIRAPFEGQVGLRNVSVGAYVSPGDVLLTLDQIDSVKLDFTVPERFLSTIRRGLPIRAKATAYPDQAFEGTISEIDSRVDQVTRAVTVRARLLNTGMRLRPGMLLAVEVRRAEHESPAVLEVSVMRNGNQAFVFGVEDSDDGSRAVRRTVKLGMRDGPLIEVVDGLSAGDIVISEGMHRASDGGSVEIKGTVADEQAALAGSAISESDL